MSDDQGWQIAWGPGQDGDDWVVVFRMDSRLPNDEGPQIVVTGAPMIPAAHEDEEDYDGPCGNEVYWMYQLWGENGQLIADRYISDSHEYRTGWESAGLSEAIERGQIAIEQIAETFEFDDWDGSPGFLREEAGG